VKGACDEAENRTLSENTVSKETAKGRGNVSMGEEA
jgi:hypothetical protein